MGKISAYSKKILGLTGGYDYDELLNQIQKDETLNQLYDEMMADFQKVVIECLIEPEGGNCKMFSRQYYVNMVTKFSQYKQKDVK